MEYIDQSIEDIRLYVVEGEVDLDQFEILRRETFVWKGIEVTAGILGASHFISFYHENKRFSEICACTEGVFSSNASVRVSDRLHNLGVVECTSQPGTIRYQFSYSINDAVSLPEQIEALTKVNDNRLNLVYEFPFHESVEESGRTLVAVDIHDTIKVQTIHTYPNIGKYVFTDSEFKSVT